jgi:integrase/recombinase XerD
MPGWKREPLEDYEVDELIEQASSMSDEHELIVRTLLHTGMRADELAHMQSSWVSWRRGEVRVQPAGDWTPKSDAGHRVIPLRDPDVRRLLNQLFSEQSDIGMSRTTIWRRVTDVAAETSISKKISPHVLRHTYGTMIAAEGASAQFIKQTMGHTNLATSQQYIEYSGRRIHQEADAIWG